VLLSHKLKPKTPYMEPRTFSIGETFLAILIRPGVTLTDITYGERTFALSRAASGSSDATAAVKPCVPQASNVAMYLGQTISLSNRLDDLSGSELREVLPKVDSGSAVSGYVSLVIRFIYLTGIAACSNRLWCAVFSIGANVSLAVSFDKTVNKQINSSTASHVIDETSNPLADGATLAVRNRVGYFVVFMDYSAVDSFAACHRYDSVSSALPQISVKLNRMLCVVACRYFYQHGMPSIILYSGYAFTNLKRKLINFIIVYFANKN